MSFATQGPYGQGFNAGLGAAERLGQENLRLRMALEEIAIGRHGYGRPAGAIARAALDGKPLPRWEGDRA